MIKVVEETIESERIPLPFDGFRIVQVTDLHDAVFGEGQSDLVQTIKEQRPDIIALHKLPLFDAEGNVKG